MKFKLAPEVLAVFVLFIVVIFIANYGSCRREPVAANSVGTYSRYRERFETAPTAKDADVKKETKVEKEKKDEKKEGFVTLSPGLVDTSSWSTIDVVGGLPSSAECIGNSLGYTKGAGGVCFDDQTKKLLFSRGGQGL
jgi:hypothetical protein